MNAAVLVVLLAVAYGASAHCGCLKCSKDLTVCGQSRPVSGCGPAQVIYRGGSGSSYSGQQFPVTLQAPVDASVAKDIASGVAKELSYKVMPAAQVTEVIEQQPIAYSHDYKCDRPSISVSAHPISLPATNLRTCVDRVVLPSAPCGGIARDTIASPALVSDAFGPAYESRRWVKPAVTSVVSSALVEPATGFNLGYNNLGLNNLGYNNLGYNNLGLNNLGYNNLGYNNLGYSNLGCHSTCNKGPIVVRRPACGPAVDVISNRCETRKCLYRYINALIPIVPIECAPNINDENTNKEIIQIRENLSDVINNVDDHCTTSPNDQNATVLNIDINNRRKREVPFLKHGYKFVMNMLPEFVQEPIKNTVNNFALTHPDEKLRKLYNQPKQLSLAEKILLQNKKNMKLLKRKLLGHHLKKKSIKKPLVNDHLIDKETITFLSGLKEPVEHSKYPWLNEIHPRFLDTEEISEFIPVHDSFDNHLGISEELDVPFENPRKPQFTEFEKAVFLNKLKTLNGEAKARTKRSTIFQNYMNRFSQDPQNHVILNSGELALPFYQVKVDDDSEENQSEYYNESDDNDNASREQILRQAIRKELKKYKYEQTKETDIVKDPFSFNHMAPQTPLFHLINLPMKLLRNFNEIPKVIRTSKRYFRDFGKNFKKNALHLVSDVIGDFDNIDSNNNIIANIVGPLRRKRSIHKSNEDVDTHAKNEDIEQYEPEYSLMFGCYPSEGAKVRKKRYILKMVDEDEVEDFLVEKLGKYFTQTEETQRRRGRGRGQSQYSDEYCPRCQMTRKPLTYKNSGESYGQKNIVLEQLKPKIIIDNNGLPFLEMGGYKKPMLRSTRKSRRKQYKTQDSFESSHPYYYSGEVDSEKIGYLIDHARDHVESSHNERFSEMPVKTVKEKISQLLLETDILVHMDFDKYDEIYDNLIALQHIKSAVEQDWKRLIISKRIDDMNAKISLLGKFQEMQHFKDMTLGGVAYALNEEADNKFITKKLLKILVRLQKLQCIINQVVENVEAKIQMGSKFDTRKEIKYVDFFTGLNFVNAKTRNEMVNNLEKDRDLALQQNIEFLDQLKKLLSCGDGVETVNEEASLLWEMRNIEKLQRSAIKDMNKRLRDGYKIKKELKILFDLLNRYEICEAEQKKLLSQLEDGSDEESSEDYSEEDVNKREPKKKFDIEEFRSRLQERLRKRKVLLRKKLKINRKPKAESCESDEDD